MQTQKVEVIKEVEFSSALAHEQSRYVDLHLMAGFAISAQPKAGGGWVVRVLRLVG